LSETDPFAEADNAVAQTDTLFRSEITDVEDYLDKLKGQDRSRIAKIIVYLYDAVMLSIILYLFIHSFVCNCDDNAFANMLDLVKVAVIPIITFVIGHYYGATRG